MRRKAAARLLFAAVLAATLSGSDAPARTLDEGLALLRSAESFERERSEAEILEAGAAALPALARALEGDRSTPADGDRIFRFRVERIFLEILDTLVAQLDKERQALTFDLNELGGFRQRREAFSLREELESKLAEWKKEDAEIEAKIAAVIQLERLAGLAKRFQDGEGLPLGEAAKAEMDRLSGLRSDYVKQEPGFLQRVEPFLRLGRIEGGGADARPLTELEEIRMRDLEENISERTPRVDAIEEQVLAIGLPAVNGLLARQAATAVPVRAHQAALAEEALRLEHPRFLPGPESFELVRYSRGLLWAWEIERGGPLAQEAATILEKHVASTVKDSEDPEMIVRERAADELYLLGGRGITALERRLAGPPRATEGGSQGRSAEAGAGQGFLLGLLRWRIRPRTFARTGIDFEDYATLTFRERRRRIFDYANAAEEEAVPTLKAIVMNDTLEPSLLVKLAAAKALAGLRDMSGYNFLAIKHPDLTLKKPEVSRELLIIQGFEHIRDKDYQRAVEEFRKILDEFPFDFRANYHIAFAYLLLQNYAKAIHHFEIARRISPRDQLTLYNLACAYALSGGKATQAIEALQASVEAGFDDYQHIENDPDLESLRDDARYQRVVEGLKTPGKP